MKHLLLALIAAYRAAKSLLPAPARCRHWPSCSAYAEGAIRLHGASAGVRMTLKRVARCHPWGSGGYDPVPEKT